MFSSIFDTLSILLRFIMKRYYVLFDLIKIYGSIGVFSDRYGINYRLNFGSDEFVSPIPHSRPWESRPIESGSTSLLNCYCIPCTPSITPSIAP